MSKITARSDAVKHLLAAIAYRNSRSAEECELAIDAILDAVKAEATAKPPAPSCAGPNDPPLWDSGRGYSTYLDVIYLRDGTRIAWDRESRVYRTELRSGY